MTIVNTKRSESVGIFAEAEEILSSFGTNIHLSYAIQKMLNEQQKLEALYLTATELHDEKETKRLKRELDSYNSSVDYSLIVALEGLEENA
tara:strand:+ start:633 stop:905 length:273 start_codon:yes stop_codon:yes gene_type:complete